MVFPENTDLGEFVAIIPQGCPLGKAGQPGLRHIRFVQCEPNAEMRHISANDDFQFGWDFGKTIAVVRLNQKPSESTVQRGYDGSGRGISNSRKEDPKA